ncbi:peptidoglycan bridge formation glycyltransferase FemA/FemB family protein [uncultured Methanolobus sp.]|uniref:lipid II:glycine glycyltransferase FemX n=1 Tax=uncultured Methanolobus sp. TaxID=218300 RepID=UPI002AAA97CA|nr:peptidoglycan bridge formation glycyltransferase FemA/FemB family protein [uncultured Methanolobus sp.]
MSEIAITMDINNRSYDEFLHNNSYSNVFQTREMAQVYSKNKAVDSFMIAAINEDTGDIVASLLAKVLDEKTGFMGSFSRHSTIRGGPIYDSNQGLDAVPLLLNEYNQIANNKKVLYSRIYPLENTIDAFPIYEKCSYIPETWNNFIINLNKSKDELWGSISKSKRRCVNKAKKQKLIFREIENRNEVKVFYELVHQRYSLRNNPLEDISNFEAVYDILVPKGMAKFFFIEHDGKCIGTRLVLLYKNDIYAWYNGSDSEYLNYYPNDFAVWSVLEWGLENGFKRFDFGGGGNDTDVSSGWVQFKRLFGGDMVNYGRYTYVHNTLKLQFAKSAFSIYKKFL